MGLLTYQPPSWHPAPPELRRAVADASKMWDGDFPNLAVGYSMKQTNRVERPLPLVIGFSTPREVHEAVKVWREITLELETEKEKRKRGEEYAQDVIRNSGYLDWSWTSP